MKWWPGPILYRELHPWLTTQDANAEVSDTMSNDQAVAGGDGGGSSSEVAPLAGSSAGVRWVTVQHLFFQLTREELLDSGEETRH